MGPGENSHGEAVNPLEIVRHLHGANSLLVPPLCPGVHRNCEFLLVEIHESGLGQVVLAAQSLSGAAAHLLDPLEQQRIPPLQGRALNRTVNRLEVNDGLLGLNPAAGVQIVVDGFEQEVPVLLDKGKQISSVDVVKLVTVGPVIVDIIDLEAAVGRQVVRLNGAKVSAQYLRGGIFLGLMMSTS